MRAVKDILQDINDVAGVLGCFVADGSGTVVASSLPGVFDQDSLTTVSKTISKTVEGLRMARKRKVSELDLVFDSGRLVIKVLSPGFLYVLCVPAMNVSLLNLTANVASKKLSAQLSAAEGCGPSCAGCAGRSVCCRPGGCHRCRSCRRPQGRAGERARAAPGGDYQRGHGWRWPGTVSRRTAGFRSWKESASGGAG